MTEKEQNILLYEMKSPHYEIKSHNYEIKMEYYEEKSLKFRDKKSIKAMFSSFIFSNWQTQRRVL